jgi:hypothetical protein
MCSLSIDTVLIPGEGDSDESRTLSVRQSYRVTQTGSREVYTSVGIRSFPRISVVAEKYFIYYSNNRRRAAS